MAKFKIQAGAELDVLTHDELKTALSAFTATWHQEVARGDRFRDIRATGTIAATAVSIGGDKDTGNNLGPSAGFVWSVQRLAVVAGTVDDVAKLTLFKNDNGPGSQVKPVLATYNSFGPRELVLYPGDVLLVENFSALGGSGNITLTGSVREVPIALAWRL
jgi:hypothetical protein